MVIKYLDANRIRGTATERAAMTTGAPTFEDTYGSVTENDGSWTKIGTWIEISSGVIKMNNGGTSSFHQMVKSLGTTLSNTAWVYEFDFLQTEPRSAFATVLSSTTGNPWSSTMDLIGVIHDSDRSLKTFYKNGASAYTVGTSVGVLSDDTQYYCRMTRTLDTNVKFEVFTDAARTSGNLFGTARDQTISATVEDLVYIQSSSLDFGSTDTGGYWQVDNSKIYDGVTTTPTLAYPNLPNGTIFEQTNDYKYYMWDGTDTWNVVGTT